LLHFEAPLTDLGFIALLTTTTYLLGGIAREQVCIYMCPWPRIQSALLDEQSRVVSYQAWRGEPRGKLADPASGDCIDCLACVQVCPTGIDIRDGHQLACIDCSLCVDACDAMMHKVGFAPGLIRWESFTGQTQRAAGLPAEWRPVRPRTVLYALVIVAVAGVMLSAMVMRQPLKATVQHDRIPLYVPISGDRLKNGYVLKLSNLTRRPQQVMVHADTPLDIALAVAGDQERPSGNHLVLTAEPDGQTTYHVMAILPKDALSAASTPLTLVLSTAAIPEIRITDHFFAPEPH
jgi:cytochrome c oxidase accessory protein FixG